LHVDGPTSSKLHRIFARPGVIATNQRARGSLRLVCGAFVRSFDIGGQALYLLALWMSAPSALLKRRSMPVERRNLFRSAHGRQRRAITIAWVNARALVIRLLLARALRAPTSSVNGALTLPSSAHRLGRAGSSCGALFSELSQLRSLPPARLDRAAIQAQTRRRSTQPPDPSVRLGGLSTFA
jgi:hypothetical protein